MLPDSKGENHAGHCSETLGLSSPLFPGEFPRFPRRIPQLSPDTSGGDTAPIRGTTDPRPAARTQFPPNQQPQLEETVQLEQEEQSNHNKDQSEQKAGLSAG